LRDGPDGSFWESLLVTAFIGLFIAAAIGKLPKQRKLPPYKKQALRNGVAAVVVSAILLMLEMAMNSLYILGAAHCTVGAAAYYLWNALGPQDKRHDLILSEFV
jgi:H+/Cl- antiporter ClcA